MCQRYALTLPPEEIRAYFGHVNVEAYPPRYNIAPTQPIAIVRNDYKQNRVLDLVRWGLIPSWVKDPEAFSTLVNARAETVGVKPSFKAAIRHRRCLIPASGFYEWTGLRGDKQPHLVKTRNGGPLAFAGIWEDWLGGDGSELQTAAILTVPANREMRAIHERMPLILEPEQFYAWLDCRSGTLTEVSDWLCPGANGFLDITPVSKLLNNWRNEGPQVQEPMIARLL